MQDKNKRSNRQARTVVPFSSLNVLPQAKNASSNNSLNSLSIETAASLDSNDAPTDGASSDSPRARLDAEREMEIRGPKPVRSTLNVVVIHLDLGIGGAERLIVNVALCIKVRSYI